MKTKGNTILITGGGTGIGRGLAEALHAAGNRIIIAGRRRSVLDDTVRANAGMVAYTLDVADGEAIAAFGKAVTREHPELNVLINMAGVMEAENLLEQRDTAIPERIVTINLLGTIRMVTALLPHLREKASATIMNVSSGLATVPLALTPTYSATKAAVHSYTESLRYQLESTEVEVLELTPPWVGTELMAGGTNNPAAMPLPDYIAETMRILAQAPTPKEICVERVRPLRESVANGSYDKVFRGLNDAMRSAH